MLQGSVELPALSPVVTQLLEALENPESTAQDVEAILSRDPAMSAKMLRLANSAYYGRSGQVSKISTAAVVLGFNTIKSLAMSASVIQSLKGFGGRAMNQDRFWGHSLGCGMAARLVSPRFPTLDPEEAFTVGLLHDLGKLLLGQFVEDEYDRVVKEMQQSGQELHLIELQRLGMSHAQVGAWLVRKWTLPAAVCEPVEKHHDPIPGGEFSSITAVVQVADHISKCSGNCTESIFVPSPSVESLVTELKIEEAEMEELISKIRTEISEIKHVVGIEEGHSETP
jgi:putative nucleotidyltransferase with HDIG domain